MDDHLRARAAGRLRGLALVVLGGLAACRIVERSRPAGPEPVAIATVPVRAWKVTCGDEHAGWVVLFQAPGEGGGRFFSVRNPWQQDVGLVDEVGRAWAYEPHRDEPVWRGSGTVAEGAERVLGKRPCRLEEVPLEQLTGDR